MGYVSILICVLNYNLLLCLHKQNKLNSISEQPYIFTMHIYIVIIGTGKREKREHIFRQCLKPFYDYENTPLNEYLTNPLHLFPELI